MDAAGGADASRRSPRAAAPRATSPSSCSSIGPAASPGLGGSIRDQSPSGENGLRLRLEGASFDSMVVWLASLQQQYGVSVSDATIDAAGAPGLVNASITLTHGARTAP